MTFHLPLCVTEHWILLLSLFTGLVYFIAGVKARKLANASFIDIAAVVISAGGVISGVKMCVLTIQKPRFLQDSSSLEESEMLYMMIGGLAVIWIAVSEVIKRFKSLKAIDPD